MADEGNKREGEPEEWKWVPSRHLAASAVVILGILTVVMITWTERIHRKGEESYLLADAIMDVQIRVASSHIELEEGYHGNRTEQAQLASSHLDSAEALCATILHGGESELGRILPPLRDPQLQAQLRDIMGMISELKQIVLKQYPSLTQDGFPRYWDEHYDSVYAALMGRARAIETPIEQSHMRDQAYSRRLLYGIFVAWSCALIAATTGLYNRERQRRFAQSALLQAHANLQTQAEELRRHREHLTELVEQRTTGLCAANRELQKEVSERRGAEEALRRSEEKYRMLIETMNEGLAILDAQGIMTYVNDRFCAMLDYSRVELLARPCADLVRSESDRITFLDHLLRIPEQGNNRFEVAFRTRNDQEVFTMVSPKRTFDADGRLLGCFFVVTDITERIALQASTMRAAHLASLGELAAGVAHEINNPTNGIINYSQLLLDGEEIGREGHSLAERIHKEGRRIADIVRSLLLFARRGRREKVPVAVGDILSNSLDLTGSQMKKDGIEILCTLQSNLPRLTADSQEIQQVFMNVLSNARYALNQKYPGPHENKILRISAEEAVTGDSHCVRIVFHDSGVGIPAGIIHKIREPFFSTKPKGTGTGLGLSISDGIVDEHGGNLTIESTEGEFTRVAIDLPAVEECNGTTAGH